MAVKPQQPEKNFFQKLSEQITSDKEPEPQPASPQPMQDGDIFLESADEFVDLKLADFTWKIRARKAYGQILVALLILQNFVVFGLVIYALMAGKMADLQIVFGVLITSTLGETAFMVKVIIEWLFKDINYPN